MGKRANIKNRFKDFLNEVNEIKPIDVDSDVEEFWNTFNQKIKDRIEDIKSRTDRLTRMFGYTMTDDYKYYDICKTDDYGRREYSLITVRAVDRDHARLKGANKMKNLEIFTTGFYDAIEVNIKKEISNIESNIKSLQSKLEELRRIS